jgi:hypothetical protein
MPGRPRTHRAQRLATAMAIRLRRDGPCRVDLMLDDLGCGPHYWEEMAPWERAASRMAIGRLFDVHGACVDVTGELYILAAARRRQPSRRRAA